MLQRPSSRRTMCARVTRAIWLPRRRTASRSRSRWTASPSSATATADDDRASTSPWYAFFLCLPVICIICDCSCFVAFSCVICCRSIENVCCCRSRLAATHSVDQCMYPRSRTTTTPLTRRPSAWALSNTRTHTITINTRLARVNAHQ